MVRIIKEEAKRFARTKIDSRAEHDIAALHNRFRNRRAERKQAEQAARMRKELCREEY